MKNFYLKANHRCVTILLIAQTSLGCAGGLKQKSSQAVTQIKSYKYKSTPCGPESELQMTSTGAYAIKWTDGVPGFPNCAGGTLSGQSLQFDTQEFSTIGNSLLQIPENYDDEICRPRTVGGETETITLLSENQNVKKIYISCIDTKGDYVNVIKKYREYYSHIREEIFKKTTNSLR